MTNVVTFPIVKRSAEIVMTDADLTSLNAALKKCETIHYMLSLDQQEMVSFICDLDREDMVSMGKLVTCETLKMRDRVNLMNVSIERLAQALRVIDILSKT